MPGFPKSEDTVVEQNYDPGPVGRECTTGLGLRKKDNDYHLDKDLRPQLHASYRGKYLKT